MSVDFFPCDKCGESICDCGSWWSCDKCEHRLCDDCARSDVVENEDEDSDECGEDICPFCAGKIATDSELLKFAIKVMKTSRAALMRDFAKAKEKKGRKS